MTTSTAYRIIPTPDVIPAQAGIHVRWVPLTQSMGLPADMDPGLRWDDFVIVVNLEHEK